MLAQCKASNQYTNPWTKEEEQFVIDNHGKLSYNQMSQVLNRTLKSIENKVRRLGLKRLSKYHYDEDFFKVIDTEEKAYWLGFIYADGYVNFDEIRHSYELGIELKYSDNNHLKKFNIAINGNIQVTDRWRNTFNKQHHMCEIRLYNKKIVKDLQQYGIVNSKTYIKQHISTFIPSYLICHFIRGFYDGDGSICVNKNRQCLQFNITNANDVILKDIRKFLYEKYKIISYISCEEHHKGATVPIYQINFKGLINAYKFGDFLYNNAHIYLDRKYLLYHQYLKEYNIIQRANKTK